MSIPSKTTIDNLPQSVSERYALDEITRNQSPLYQEIASPQAKASPQIGVFQPIQESHLDLLTGALGKTQALAQYATPNVDFDPKLFSLTVYPQLLEKDKSILLEKLESLSEGPNGADASKLKSAVSLLSDLNQMGLDAFLRMRQLQQG